MLGIYADTFMIATGQNRRASLASARRSRPGRPGWLARTFGRRA